jgi:hypothetical protein
VSAIGLQRLYAGDANSIWNFYEQGFSALSNSYALIGQLSTRPWPQGERAPLTSRGSAHHRMEQPMLDFILLSLGLGFFALSIAYAFGCERL